MANPFQADAAVTSRYRKMRDLAQQLPRNQIAAGNELRPLFPGTGETHQLTGQDLTLDDAVLTIAAVLLGVSQIKYPYKIAFGDLDFYRSLGTSAINGRILPEDSDAFISPINLDKVAGATRKRKLDEVQPTTPEPHGKRHKTYDTMSIPSYEQNFILAVCEPEDNTLDHWMVDVSSIRPNANLNDQETDEGRILSIISSRLLSGDWKEQPPTFAHHVRSMERPFAPKGYEVHAAILHAWAYILDLPINPYPTRAIGTFRTELLDLFNLALRGQMSYALFKRFLKDTGYLYPGRDLDEFMCIDKKYLAELNKFTSVEIHKDAEVGGQPSLDIARFSQDREAPLSDVRNAIGCLWRRSLSPEFQRTTPVQFSFATEQNVTFEPRPGAPLMLLHRHAQDGWIYTYLSTAKVLSKQAVEITHYGINAQQASLKDFSAWTERTLRRCGWHGADNVTHVRFTHVFTDTPTPPTARDSSLYAIAFAWCLLLGLHVAHSESFLPFDEEVEIQFAKNSEEMINFAYAGQAHVGAIKTFLESFGFTSNPRRYPGDSTILTVVQPASGDALGDFIKRKRADQDRVPNLPDSPSVLEPAYAALTSVRKYPETRKSTPGSQTRKLSSSLSPSKDPRTKRSQPIIVLSSTPDPPADEATATKSPSPQAAPERSSIQSRRSSKSKSPSVPVIVKLPSKSKSKSPTTAKPADLPAKAKAKSPTPASPIKSQAKSKSRSKSPTEPVNVKLPSKTKSPSERTSSDFSGESKSWSLSPTSKRATRATSQRRATPRALPPAAVLPWGEYRNPERFRYFDTLGIDKGKTWMQEFMEHMKICQQLRDAIIASRPDVRKTRFTTENGKNPIDGADRSIVCDMILSLWKPLWDRTWKFGVVDIDYVRLLQEEELSRNGIQAAAGGPYPFLMAMHGTSLNPSPRPDKLSEYADDMGHIWLGVGTIRGANPNVDDGELPPSRQSTKEHPIHVDVAIYDTAPGLLKANKTETKPAGLVKYSGWAVGAREGEDNHGETSLIPRHWDPTIHFHHLNVPNQTEDRGTKRINACGLLTTLNAWMVMLDLPIRSQRAMRHKTADFYSHLIQLFDLALAGALTTRTIQAFANAYGYIAKEQPITASVVEAQTEDPAGGRQLIADLVRDQAFYPYAPSP